MGGRSTMGIRSHVRKMGDIGLNNSLIYIHPLFHSHHNFYLPLFNSVAEKNSKVGKILGVKKMPLLPKLRLWLTANV
jgi:hypothetical protein